MVFRSITHSLSLFYFFFFSLSFSLSLSLSLSLSSIIHLNAIAHLHTVRVSLAPLTRTRVRTGTRARAGTRVPVAFSRRRKPVEREGLTICELLEHRTIDRYFILAARGTSVNTVNAWTPSRRGSW